MLRYHRVIFMWFICLVLNNIMALMVFIFFEFAEIQRSKEAQGIGYKHFSQNHLGNQLIKHGLKLAGVFWRREAAIKVTTFMRFCLAKIRVAAIRAALRALPRQSGRVTRPRAGGGTRRVISHYTTTCRPHDPDPHRLVIPRNSQRIKAR